MRAEHLLENDKKELREYLTSHSFGDERIAHRDLAFYFLPKQPLFRFFSSHPATHGHPTSIKSDGWFSNSPDFMTLIINRKSAKKYGYFLTNNRKSLEERKQAYELAYAASRPPNTTNATVKKMVKSQQKLFPLILLRDLQIDHMVDLHRHSSMAIIPYASSSVHVDLIVHKNAASNFGLK